MLAALLFSGAVFFSPAAVFAEAGDQSVAALQQQITALLTQITSLKQQLAHLQGGTISVSVPPSAKPEPGVHGNGVCPDLSHNLSLGDRDNKMRAER